MVVGTIPPLPEDFRDGGGREEYDEAVPNMKHNIQYFSPNFPPSYILWTCSCRSKRSHNNSSKALEQKMLITTHSIRSTYGRCTPSVSHTKPCTRCVRRDVVYACAPGSKSRVILGRTAQSRTPTKCKIFRYPRCPNNNGRLRLV